MKKILMLLFIGISCSPRTGFDAFFEDEVVLADQAIDVPKWLPLIAIPKDAKEEIKLFTKGMKKVKLLRYERKMQEGKTRFFQFKQKWGMEEFLSVTDKEANIKLISKEEEGAYKEILIAVEADNEFYILGLTGKMAAQDFQAAVVEANNKVTNNTDE